MKYTADIFCPLAQNKVTTVEFDDCYESGVKKPYDLKWLAQCAAEVKGVRYVQYLVVKNIKEKA